MCFNIKQKLNKSRDVPSFGEREENGIKIMNWFLQRRAAVLVFNLCLIGCRAERVCCSSVCVENCLLDWWRSNVIKNVLPDNVEFSVSRTTMYCPRGDSAIWLWHRCSLKHKPLLARCLTRQRHQSLHPWRQAKMLMSEWQWMCKISPQLLLRASNLFAVYWSCCCCCCCHQHFSWFLFHLII